MLILTFEDSEEEILNHIISCVNTGARAFQVIENAKTNLSYGDIVILLDKRELFRKQEKIDLSFIEFEILHLLMRSPGRVFSKEQIYDIIWNEPYSGDYNVVMRHICNIREKIEDDPGQPMYIKNRFWFFWRVIIAFGKHPEKPLPQSVVKFFIKEGFEMPFLFYANLFSCLHI